MAKIIELIYSEETRGLGKEEDPVRCVKKLYSKSGNLVAEYDPCKDGTCDVDEMFFSPRNID